MLTNISTDPGKKPRLLGELGELSHRKVSSAEYKYRRGTEIFGAEEPAEYIYQVTEGAVRSYKLLTDGRRQIGGFHLPGDIFGLENGDPIVHGRSHRQHYRSVYETRKPGARGEN